MQVMEIAVKRGNRTASELKRSFGPGEENHDRGGKLNKRTRVSC